ncbi:uncharacterized protein LOC126846182 isoform X2 [Adelges cooleyi]|uniref:uncharacterized protein LOC126846182 isoform X2 n=1 Tax=Adelges cooleyi TaxID=133065 RepID=UPI00217F77CF|nr:uncharacterized protein LOC126846182 isoform X2 [Adelges cooleyi]
MLTFFHKTLFVSLSFLFIQGLQAHDHHAHHHGASLHCLFKVNRSNVCTDNAKGYQTEIQYLFNGISHEVHEKLLSGSPMNLTEIATLPADLLYFIPVNKLGTLRVDNLVSILLTHEDNSVLAKKIFQSVSGNARTFEFLNILTQRPIKNERNLNILGETVYKWKIELNNGKLQKLTLICGHAYARLWSPYMLTQSKIMAEVLFNNLEQSEEHSHRRMCVNSSNVDWKDLSKNVKRLWSFLAVKYSYPKPLDEWSSDEIDRYNFLLLGLRNDELSRLTFNDQSTTLLHKTDFDHAQARFLFYTLMQNQTLGYNMIHYKSFIFKLSPMQLDEFQPYEFQLDEWAKENQLFSFAAAKQIFNKIARQRYLTKPNSTKSWSFDDLRHLPLLYTQPPSVLMKFCDFPLNTESLISADSSMISARQAFYLSGCSSMLSLHKNNQELLLGLNYLLKALPVSSLMTAGEGFITYQVVCHLVAKVDEFNLPLALQLLDTINQDKNIVYIEEMLKNDRNILFEQLSPADITGPLFDGLQQLYSNYKDRIDRLPKHIIRSILEDDDLLFKWTGNKSIGISHGLYNGYTCGFIKKLNGVEFIESIYNFNNYLERHGKMFPKDLQPCFAKAFMKYLHLKSVFSVDNPSVLFLEEWEIEAVRGFVLITLPVEDIIKSDLTDSIVYAIGRLSLPELLIAAPKSKIQNLVHQYIDTVFKNSSVLNIDHLYTLGNLTHFIGFEYLSKVDGKAFKILLEIGLFDTRICFGANSKDQWANLVIRAFGNPDSWMIDTLVTLSDSLIVLNETQLSSIPVMSRLNSADIIKTHYADIIEWMPTNVPFYEACMLFENYDRHSEFTRALSDLVDFHLVSMQNQLQRISSVEDYRRTEEGIPSQEVNTITVSSTTNSSPIGVVSTLEPDTDVAGSEQFTSTPETTSPSPTTPENYNLYVSKGNESTEKVDYAIVALSDNKRDLPSHYRTAETNATQQTTTPENPTFNNGDAGQASAETSSFSASVEYSYSTTESVELGFVSETTIVQPITDDEIRRKRSSDQQFFNWTIRIGCDAIRVLGPASVMSSRFESIVNDMTDDELNDCADSLGSFQLNSTVADLVWPRIQEKHALHTYGSVLSGISSDDVRTLNLDIHRPWTLELINSLGKHVTSMSARKEIANQFMAQSEENNRKMPPYLWGLFGSLMCQLQPRTVQLAMLTKELFWKSSSAFTTITTCDEPCVKNLASIAISKVGQSDTWKTAEVERMGIIVSGINTTQWKLLLDNNPGALEGLTSHAVECLHEPQIKLMNETHFSSLTPKSAFTMLKNHFKHLDVKQQETLSKVIDFEMNATWITAPAVVVPISNSDSQIPKSRFPVDRQREHVVKNAFAIGGMNLGSDSINNQMQADSKAATLCHTLLLTTLSLFVLLFVSK